MPDLAERPGVACLGAAPGSGIREAEPQPFPAAMTTTDTGSHLLTQAFIAVCWSLSACRQLYRILHKLLRISRQSPQFSSVHAAHRATLPLSLPVAQAKKNPGTGAGAVQQGGAYDNPHMRRDLMDMNLSCFQNTTLM
jgi:hypothetical protein